MDHQGFQSNDMIQVDGHRASSTLDNRAVNTCNTESKYQYPNLNYQYQKQPGEVQTLDIENYSQHHNASAYDHIPTRERDAGG